MKIAIPVVNKQLCLHFGHCEQFALFEVDEETKTIHKQEFLTPPPHEPGVLPRWLAELGTNLIIVGGMGSRAQTIFQSAGVKVIVGAPVAPPEKLIKDYLNRELTTGANVCDH